MDAERNVLSTVLRDPAHYWRVADRVRAEDFSAEAFRTVWGLIADRLAQGKAADSVTLCDVRTDLMDLIIGLTEFYPMQSAIEQHADAIAAAADVRRLQQAGQRIAHLTGDDAFGQAQRMLVECQPRTRDAVKSTRDGLREMVDTLKARLQNREVTGLSWGVPALDELYRPEPEHLVVIAARPKMGKTAITMQCALLAAKDGGRGYIASLEMSLRDLTERAVAHLGNLPLAWIKRPREAPAHAFAQIEAGATVLEGLPLLIDDTPSVSVDQVIARAMQLHMAEPLKFVVVDHLGLLNLRGDNEVRELGLVTKALKGLAKTLKIPVLLVVQLNRGVEKRADGEPQPSDLRGSGRIEEDADAVLMLYRDLNGNKGLAKALLRMNRHGETGEVVMREHLARMRFEGTDDEWTTARPPQGNAGASFAQISGGSRQPRTFSRAGYGD